MLSLYTKIKYYIPCFIVIAIVMAMNLFQYPMTDEWSQIMDPSIHEGPYYIISRYFTFVSRFGDIVLRFFLYHFRNNIFVEQTIFGFVNGILFGAFLFNLYYLLTKQFCINNKKEMLLFLGIFFCVYLSGHFNQSYINQPGATTYFWAIYYALMILIPYYFYLTDKSLLSRYSSITLSIWVFLWGLLVGWSSELLGPILLVAMGFVFLHYTFIKKQKLPLWFYIGGVMIFIGWCLVFFGPGHRLRNASWDYYVPLLERSFILIITRTLSWFGIYFAASLPLIIPSILVLRHIKKYNPIEKMCFNTILSFLLLGILAIFMWALMLQWLIPPRAWITFTFFFILSAIFSLKYYLEYIYTPQKKLLKIMCGILICLGGLHIIEIIKYRKVFSPIFVELQSLKDQGIKEADIEVQNYSLQDAFFLRWVDNFFMSNWVVDKIGLYYGVEKLNFIDPKTKESYR